MTSTTRKPGERPPHVKPPAHLTKSPPVPEADPPEAAEDDAGKDGPTRYGDWVSKGIAIDF